MPDDVISYLERNFPADLEAVREFLRQPSISYTGGGSPKRPSWCGK